MTDYRATHPKLRLVETIPYQYQGAAYLMLRDPLNLSEQSLLVPQAMTPILALCDGTRGPAQIRAVASIRYGTFYTLQQVEETLRALDEAYLLENDRSAQARRDALEQYRNAPSRVPSSAGASYPEDPEALAAYLQGFHKNAPPPAPTVNGNLRGLVSPHIDYQRGGPVYAQVWAQAEHAVRSADLAVIFGTDHFSEGFPFSLTRQNYATPFGVLPTEQDAVSALAEAIGEETAFAGELHHRGEHSIELAAVWLHFARKKRPIHLIPILTGSLDGEDRLLQAERLLKTLRHVTRGRRVIAVAAGDLAHVGPAFDTPPVDDTSLTALKTADDELVRHMITGSAEGFLEAIHRVEDRNNVCGVSPIYLTMRLLEPVRGEAHGYAICPADQQNTSVVTICGVTLF